MDRILTDADSEYYIKDWSTSTILVAYTYGKAGLILFYTMGLLKGS